MPWLWGSCSLGMIQLLFQLPALHGLGLVPRPRWDTGYQLGVRRILTLMVPALFGVSVSQINLLLGHGTGVVTAGGKRVLALLQ